jgi:hypothetical protein
MSIFIGIVISVLTGIFSTVLFWWWQAKLLTPKVKICPTLGKYVFRDGKNRYQFKVTNIGRRPVAEITIIVRIIMPGLLRPGARQILTLCELRRPWLKKGQDVLYPIHPDQMSKDDKEEYSSHFPDPIADALLKKTDDDVDLIEFLQIRPGSVIQVHVVATDSFSIARAYFEQEFGLDDFRDSPFIMNSCDHAGQPQEAGPVEDLTY